MVSHGVAAQGEWLREQPGEIRRDLLRHREPQSLLRHFAELVRQTVSFDSLEFEHSQPALAYNVPAGSAPYAGGFVFTHPVAHGTLRFLRSHPYDEVERQLLETFSGLLQGPLRNAIRRYFGHHRSEDSLPSMASSALTSLPLEQLIIDGELDSAIRDDRLTIHYQPKVEMKNGRVVGLEALLRWDHHEHGLISPEHFIPLAERHGRIRAITRWVLSTVIRQCADWQKEGLLVPIAVNISGLDLVDSELPGYVAEQLRRWSVPSLFIELEITETAAIADHRVSREVLSRLAELGIAVAIDDFGTGYSSLLRLKQFPFNTIKIDKSFVMDAGRLSNEMVFVDTITQLGHRLGMKVVAEGVECSESWQRLLAAGCDVGQGYHISRPLPGEVMTGWLRDGAQHVASKIG